MAHRDASLALHLRKFVAPLLSELLDPEDVGEWPPVPQDELVARVILGNRVTRGLF